MNKVTESGYVDNRMRKLILFVFSISFAVAVMLSAKMPTDFKKINWLGFELSDWLLLAVMSFAVLFVVSFLNILLDRSEKCFPAKRTNGICKVSKGNRVNSTVIFLGIFLSWFLVFLAFYPGNLSPDSYSSINQALNQITSTAHPVLFTLMVRVCLKIGLFLTGGNMNFAIATYSVLQMLALSAVLTYTVRWLAKHSVPKWMLILTVLHYSWNPLIARYSFTMWKDIPFNTVFLLVILFLLDIANGNADLLDGRDLAKFTVLALLAAFLRNRIIYTVVAIFAFLFIGTVLRLHRKGAACLSLHRKAVIRMAVTFVAASAFTIFMQGSVYNMLGIKPSKFAEGQGVSLQQIAAIVTEGGEMSEEEAEFISKIMPLEDFKDNYSFNTVDSLKGADSFDHDFLDSHSKEYVHVWLSVIRKNPKIAVKSWLMTTRGFWGFNVYIEPFAITWPSSELGIYQTNFIKKWTGIDLAYISDGILVHIEDVPVVRRFFELGCLGWFGVFCVMRLLIKKRNRAALAWMPMILLWLVLIFSTPTFFEPRYMFVFNLALPVMGCQILVGELKYPGCPEKQHSDREGKH